MTNGTEEEGTTTCAALAILTLLKDKLLRSEFVLTRGILFAGII